MRPTFAQIDLAAIRHNMQAIRNVTGPAAQIIAVVKADAYGHGGIPVAKAALQAGAGALAVAIPEEGMSLREAGIKAPILVLGLFLPGQAGLFVEHDLTATAATPDNLLALADAARQKQCQAKVMIKLDTGMGRIGVFPHKIQDLLRYAAALPEIKLLGVFTHLADADASDKTHALQQIHVFRTAISKVAGATPLPVISAANSAAIIDLPQGHFSAVRPGIILYGLPPSGEMLNQLDLQPAMELKTRIVYLKKVPAGTTVSYGCTYVTPQDTYLATLPIGYADGYSRHLSNLAPVLVGGRRRQLVGRVCMDQIIVDIGEVCDAKIGDEAVLFGRQGAGEISVTELADLAGTINYELVCAISPRVPRIYINE